MTRLANGRLSDLVGIKLAQIDCESSKKLCDRFGVESYPSLRVLEGGRTYEYEGQPSAADIIRFLEDRAYAGSKGVYELTKKRVKEVVPNGVISWVEWQVRKMFDLTRSGYLGSAAVWFFRYLGLSTLSIATQMVGFTLLVIAPIVLFLMYYLVPKFEVQDVGKPRGVNRVPENDS